MPKSTRADLPIPRPSRLVLNLGILAGAAVGFLIQSSLDSDNVQSFLITGGCALLGALVFSLAEIGLRRRRQSSE